MKKMMWMVFAILLLSGCGRSGADGTADIKFWWSGTLTYWDNNPDTPDQLAKDFYYNTHAGDYNFSYTAFNGRRFTGYYTITVQAGGLANGFSDGADGRDVYFELGLLSTGPKFYDWGVVRNAVEEGAVVVSAKLEPAMALMGPFPIPDMPPKVIEQVRGKQKLTVKYWRVN